MTRQTVTIYVPPGYANGDDFARDCGFEIVTPPLKKWDAFDNRRYAPVERRAKEIFDGFAYNGPGEKPEWFNGGNSNKQDDARRMAREELAMAGHVDERTPSLLRHATAATMPDPSTPEGRQKIVDNSRNYRDNLKPFA